MGTIAQKFNYSFEAKDLIKDSINNLGGSITSETELKEYATELDNIYSNLPKVTGEDTNITLSPTLKGKLDFEDGIVGYGDTKQDTTTGINLMDVSAVGSGTRNGITLTNNGDGTFTLNGTATAQNIFTLANMTLDTSKTYTLTGCPSGGSSTTYFIAGANFGDYGSGVTDIPNREGISFSIVTQSGAVLNNVLFKPMLIEGSTQKPFEKYTGGIASPNPTYPQDIEVVRGKNLFGDTLRQGVTNYQTGTYNADNTARITTTNWLTLPKGTYTISAKNNANKLLQVSNITFDTSGNYYEISGTTGQWKNMPFTITFPQDTKWQCNIGYSDGSEITPSQVSEFQLEKGSTATSYLPYNTLEVVERGKNLWYSSEYNNTYADLNIKFTNNKVILNGTNSRAVDLRVVDVSNNWNTNSQSILNYINNKNGNYCASNNSGFDTYFYMSSGSYSANTTQVTDSVKVNSIFIRIPINSTFTNKDIEFQLQEGSTATTYEPYQTPQTYQLSLGEYEFAKIGNYVDTIEYDVENDKVYKNKNVNKKVFDDTTFFQYDLTNAVFYYGITNRAVGTETTQNIYCDKLFWNGNFSGVGNTGSMQKYQIACNNNGTSKNIFIKNTDYNATNTFNAWLISINASFYYPLAETVKQEITGTLKDQIKALYYSHSFTGTTIIEIDGQLPLIIKVRALKGE